MGDNSIILVEYLNTEPFLHGLKTMGTNYSLIRKIPSECVKSYLNKEADVALIPLAEFFKHSDSRIITNYGIACNGKVRTVMLSANDPLESLEKVYLDNHSRTSAALVKIIIEQFWNKRVEFIQSNVENVSLKAKEGVLMIGDKVFRNENKYAFNLDLGEEWKKHTGLPFVFAVWVAKKELSIKKEEELNAIFKFGVSEIPTLIKSLNKKNNMDLSSYFQNNIVYEIHEDGRKAIELFRAKI